MVKILLLLTATIGTIILFPGEDSFSGDREQQPLGRTGEVSVWLTTPDRLNLLTPQKVQPFTENVGSDALTIEVNPQRTFQTIDGFGAAVTGSAAYLINHTMSEEQRDELLDDLFTAKGINISYIRHTIGASDFSVDANGQSSSYTYDDTESGEPDYELNHFSIAKDTDVIQLLQKIMNKKEGIKLLGTPWSAPTWMKYGEKTLNGWYLDYTNPQVYSAYAEYFVRYIKAYEQAGIPVEAITVQNEPEFTTPDYPSMSMAAPEQARFIRDYLGPAFKVNGLDTKIIGFDHNWDIGEEYAKTLLADEEASAYTDGTAYHCYAGSPEAMSRVHDAYPDKHIYVTECSGGAWSADFGNNLSWQLSNLIIGGTRNWAQNVLLWNIALDPEGGPVNGGCTNCRGVMTIDPSTGALTRNEEYYAIGHASKFVQPGAVRVDSTQHSGSIENVAFRNPDGTVVLIAVNVSAGSREFIVKQGAKSFSYNLPSHAAVTFTWQQQT